MNENFVESRQAVMHAREALRNGSLNEAREWAERAAQLAPQSEDPWLILAAIVSPRDSMDYIRKALQANPNSPRAIKGMQWALQRLGKSPKSGGGVTPENRNRISGTVDGKKSRHPQSSGKPRRRNYLFPIFLIIVGCAVFLFAAWSAVTSPVLASILNISSAPVVQSTPAQSFAQVNLPKPTYTPQSVAQLTVFELPGTPTLIPDVLPTQEIIIPTVAQEEGSIDDLNPPPTDPPYIEVSPTEFIPEITETPGVAYVEIVPDTPTSEYVAPTVAPYVPPQAASYDGQHWIDVDLSQQRLYAYAGDTMVNSFIVSTGTWQTPTVTGKYKIWIKLRTSDMSGPGYYLPDVPYVMYFYKGYGIHGTYWHNNFGTPMSHGCVNLTIPDAEWLYNFSYVGTVVNVHY